MTAKPLTRADLKARYDRARDLLRAVDRELRVAQVSEQIKREVAEFLEAIE